MCPCSCRKCNPDRLHFINRKKKNEEGKEGKRGKEVGGKKGTVSMKKLSGFQCRFLL